MSAPSPFRTFEHDARNEAAVVLVRAVAIVGTLVSIGGLALALPTWVGGVFALLGLAAIAGWTVMVLRGRARVRSRVSLDLAPERLRYEDGSRVSEVAWEDVESVAVDEDRLDVVVERRGAEPLRVEPFFKGASVYELADAIRMAWSTAAGESAPAAARSNR